AACTSTGRSLSPPGAIVTRPGRSIAAPPLAVCGASETVQVPPPPPASRSRTSWLRSCAPWVTSTYWNESELGVVKIRGSAAGRRDVRLQDVAERRQPGRREARHDPAAAGDQLLDAPADADRRAASRAGHERAEPVAVLVRDHRRRQREQERDLVRLAGAVV